MLTLDSEQLERQRQITRAREQQHRTREMVRANREAKERTVANDGLLVTTDMAQQWGCPMTSVQLFEKLKVLNPGLIYEVTKNNDRLAGLYRMKDVLEDGVTRRKKAFICGMERGFMPERSVRVPRIEKVAGEDGLTEVHTFDHEIRGWRTVLARLIQERLITKTQAETAFPLSDGQSSNWQRLTT